MERKERKEFAFKGYRKETELWQGREGKDGQERIARLGKNKGSKKL